MRALGLRCPYCSQRLRASDGSALDKESRIECASCRHGVVVKINKLLCMLLLMGGNLLVLLSLLFTVGRYGPTGYAISFMFFAAVNGLAVPLSRKAKRSE